MTAVVKTSSPSNALSPAILKHYQQAGQIATAALKHAVTLSTPGTPVATICSTVNTFITEMAKKVDPKTGGVAFPCCLSIGHILCHHVPMAEEKTIDEPEVILKAGDVVKIEAGVQISGYAALRGSSFICGSGADIADLDTKTEIINSAKTALKNLIATLKPGNNNLAIEAEAVNPDTRLKFIQGMMSHRIDKGQLSGEDVIVLNPVEGQRRTTAQVDFRPGQVWVLDGALSTGTGAIRPAPFRTTVYAKTGTPYPLKLKTSRTALSEITAKSGLFPFALSQLESVERHKARIALTECLAHNVVMPYEVLMADEGASSGIFTIRFVATVIIKEDGSAEILGGDF